MTYYFFDEKGKIYLTYYVTPPAEVLENNKNYIISEKRFEEKQGFYLDLKVDLVTKELISEYLPIPPKEEDKLDIIMKEMTSLKEQMNAIQQTINSKK